MAITIYTDGSCRNNPGPGGFGVVVVENDKVIHCYSKQCNETTNNREEIKAILYSIILYGNNGYIPTIYSDSAYCVNTFTNWMYNWHNNGWIKSDKKVPENLDLIKEYYNLENKGYRIDLRKIKGHAGHTYNELADQLATGAITAKEAMKIYG